MEAEVSKRVTKAIEGTIAGLVMQSTESAVRLAIANEEIARLTAEVERLTPKKAEENEAEQDAA